MLIDWSIDGLTKIGLNDRDYLLALSHDDKLDLPALKMGMKRNVRYIGMLSSRKTRDSRFKQLESESYNPDDIK